MSRRSNGSGGAWGAGDRWQDGVDNRIAELEDRMYETALILRGLQEWQRNHEERHTSEERHREELHREERQDRKAIPDDVRGWIATAISIVSLLLVLYLNSHH